MLVNNKLSVLVLILVLTNRIQSKSVKDYTLNLCQNSTDVSYENYTSPVVQNCGCEKQDTCVRKCCQKGFFHNHNEDPNDATHISVCSKHEPNEFTLPVDKHGNGEHIIDEVINDFLVGMLNCNNSEMIYIKFNGSDPESFYYLFRNGSLLYRHQNLLLSNERYCVDEGDGRSVYICFQEADKGGQVEATIHVAAKIISVPFLLVTGLVYAFLPERNLHKIALMFHVFSLLLGNALLAVGQYTVIEDDSLCFCVAYLILLCMVASFFWMNIICIDIWLAFSGFRGFYVPDKIKRRIFVIASLYAWGPPTLNVLIVFFLNNYGDEEAEYHPGIGVESCFLKNGLPTIIFYFGPILVIIIINIVLFILTAGNIRKVKNETKIVKSSQSKKHSNNEEDKIKLYWKLLFVMGLNPVVNTHLIQIISWTAGRKWSHDVAVYVWYFKDFAHASYGILIFVIFVCQKKIWMSLKERYRCINTGKFNKNATKTSITTSSNIPSSENSSGIRLRGIQNLAADVP